MVNSQLTDCCWQGRCAMSTLEQWLWCPSVWDAQLEGARRPVEEWLACHFLHAALNEAMYLTFL